MSQPKVCSMPQLRGRTVETKESLTEVKPADINLDGNQDEYFTVTKRTIKICGEMPEQAVMNSIRDMFGTHERFVDTDEGGKLYGRTWRAEYKIADEMTTVVTYLAAPVFSGGPTTKFTLKSIGKTVMMGDPVKLKGKKVYFVTDVSLADAIRWDGKQMTVDPSKVKVLLMTKEGVMKVRNKQKPAEEDIVEARLADIKDVLPRSKFEDVYAQN